MQTKTNAITTDEVLDSRDIIDRCDQLIGELLPFHNEKILTLHPEAEPLDSADALDDDVFLQWLKDTGENDDDSQELIALIELCRECDGIADWSYGETLIRADYFTEYTKEMLTDCGYIPKDLPSWIEIDWEKTADNVKADYTYVNFMGEEYWIRNC